MLLVILTVLCLLILPTPTSAADSVEAFPSYSTWEPEPNLPPPCPVPWAPGHKSKSDWANLIDITWGEGPAPALQLYIFDGYWNDIDRRYAAFHGIEDERDQLRAHYLDEVTAGVSRGRLAGILGRMSQSLQDSYVKAYDNIVNGTFPGRGVPLLFGGNVGARVSYLGAAVTALDDGTGLVYATKADNPLGLAPGDIILGYDGRAWGECLAELQAAELPVRGMWGSAYSAWVHHWTASVGSNWHLFDVMDVLEHATGDTVHLATAAVDGYASDLFGSEQLAVGIPFPDLTQDETVTWGTIERDGHQIGYIYVFSWWSSAGDDFRDAVDELTQNPDLVGLIVDFRSSMGGNMFLSDAGLNLLFASSTPTIEWFVRCAADEHLPLCNQNMWQTYIIDPDSTPRYYDRPIAMLTGPNASGSGEQVALRLTYHPTVRVFGKSTAGTFGAAESYQIVAGYTGLNSIAESARLDALDAPLTRSEFPVDEPVWLLPDDVARGIDTVVEAAAHWIVGNTGVEDPDLPPGPALPEATVRFLGARPNPFNPKTELIISLARPGNGELVVFDLAGRRVRTFALAGYPAGEHRLVWDGLSDTGSRPPSGSYVIQLRTEERVLAGRVTMIK